MASLRKVSDRRGSGRAGVARPQADLAAAYRSYAARAAAAALTEADPDLREIWRSVAAAWRRAAALAEATR